MKVELQEGGGFGRISPPHATGGFENRSSGFGLSSQRAQLNATPSSYGVGGSGGLPFGGRPTNARLNSDFNSSADSGFHHTGGLLSNYGTKGESAGYGISMGSGHPSRPPPCRYWDKEGKHMAHSFLKG